MSDCLGMCLQIIDNGVSIGTSAWGVCVYVMQPRSGEDPELRNTLKNASYRGGRAANDLTIPQPKVMAAYGLYGPATAKQIKRDEMRQTHTYCNKQPLDLEEASFPVNLSVNAAGVPPTASA